MTCFCVHPARQEYDTLKLNTTAFPLSINDVSFLERFDCIHQSPPLATQDRFPNAFEYLVDWDSLVVMDNIICKSETT